MRNKSGEYYAIKGLICLMVLFTKKINIFYLCIDKLMGAIYNRIRYLCTYCVFSRTLSMALAVTLFFFSLPIGLSASDMDNVSFRITAEWEDDESLCIKIALDGEMSLCGILAELFYEGEKLEMVSADGLGKDVFFADHGDRVRFVADGNENFISGDTVAFFFKAKTSDVGELRFDFFVREAYAFAKKGELLNIGAARESLTVNQAELSCDVCLCGVNVSGDGELTAVSLCAASSTWRIAAGFEISVLDLTSGSVDRYSTVSAVALSDGGGFRFDHGILIPSIGTFCIAVRPIIYGGQGIKFGISELLTFCNGELVNKIQIK